MKTFNKILKITLVVLLFALAVTGVTCYLTIPTETKEFMAWLIDALNKPLPIAGITTAAVLVFIYKLVLSTSYGRRTLEKFKKTLADYKSATDKQLEAFERKKEEYQLLINAHQLEIDYLKSSILAIANESPNKKVKECAESYLNAYELKKKEIARNIDLYRDQFKELYEKNNIDLEKLKADIEIKFEDLKKELIENVRKEAEERIINNSSKE